MLQTIEVSYSPTREDYLQVSRFLRTDGKKAFLFSLVLYLIITMILLLALGTINNVGVILLVLAGFPLFYHMNQNNQEKQTEKMKIGEAALQQLTYLINNEGIKGYNKDLENTVSWAYYESYTETEDQVILWRKNARNAVDFLPKRAFVSGQHYTEFQDYLERFLNNKPYTPGKPFVIFKKKAVLVVYAFFFGILIIKVLMGNALINFG